MTNPNVLGDDPIRAVADLVTRLCLDPRFEELLRELTVLYADAGSDNPRESAYRDALYVMLQESGDNVAIPFVPPPTPTASQRPPESMGSHR